MQFSCIIFFAIPLFFSPVFAANFHDLSTDHIHYKGLKYMLDIGAMEGYPDGTLRPDAVVSRAEFLKIILQGTDHMRLGIGDRKNCFPDVTTEWYAPFVCYAFDQGLVKGYPDGLFHPEQPVNFVEAAKILHILFYGDLPRDEKRWYRPYVKILTRERRVPFTIDSLNKFITRGETAMLVWALAKPMPLIPEGGFVFDQNGAARQVMGGFTRDDKHVYHGQAILDLDPKSFQLVTQKYGKDNRYVYYLGNRKNEVDAKTFHRLNDSSYYKDAKYIYYEDYYVLRGHKVIQNVDYATFVPLNGNYAQDKNHVYYEGDVLDADVATFSLLNPDQFLSYAKDKQQIFYSGQKVGGVDAASFEPLLYPFVKDKNGIFTVKSQYLGDFQYVAESLPKVNPKAFQALPYSYGKDNWNVYWLDESSKPATIVPGADALTFSTTEGSYQAKDKNFIYYRGKPIDGSDGSTAVLMPDGFVKDKNHVYRFDKILTDVDAKTFESLGDGYAKDKNSVYFFAVSSSFMTIVPNADIKTFEVTRFGYAKDNYAVYYHGIAGKREYSPV